jgi:hypothetical protein
VVKFIELFSPPNIFFEFVEKLEFKLKLCTDEITKGNEIITKYKL